MSAGAFRGTLPQLAVLKQLRTQWPSRGWSWDGRLQCVSSSFQVEFEAAARSAVAIALPTEWRSSTIDRAPPVVRDLATRSGGLRSGQMILTSDLAGAIYPYGLWWPWGDGMTTSLRIGLSGKYVPEEYFQGLREVFGAEI